MEDLPGQENLQESFFTMQNNIRHPAKLLQLLPTERIFPETKQNQETDHSLKLSLGGIYSNGKTLMRSSSVIGVETGKNVPERFLSLSKSFSLPADTKKKNKGCLLRQPFLHNINDQFHVKTEYPYRQLILQDWQGFTLHNPNSVLQRNHLESHEGPDNVYRHHKPFSPLKNPKPEFVRPEFFSHSNESTTNTHLYNPSAIINGIPNGLKSFKNLPISPTELKNDVNHEDGSNKKSRASIPEDNMELILSRMPSVTTVGDGPGGRKIEGFLYRYTRSQVSIVCVCHGRFLTPAEFVEHAGGRNVGDPMKRINVLPGSFCHVR